MDWATIKTTFMAPGPKIFKQKWLVVDTDKLIGADITKWIKDLAN